MKIYAKQIPPEWQESPLFYGDFPENIILDGNRNYNSHTIPVYDAIINHYDEAAQEIENLDLKNGYAAYSNATEAINDYFPALEYREKPYNTRDIHRIREALRLYGTAAYYNGRYITAMLDAITGGDWYDGTIRGCCQGDWQTVIYDAKYWSRDRLDTFEIEYFNTGTEWMIHDGDTAPEGPEDIDGFTCYCHGWNDEQIKAEIADVYGAPGAEVLLYEFTGYSKTAQYQEVTA